MSSIITVQCSNHPKCPAAVSLRCNFPLWKENTPPSVAKLPVGIYRKKFVSGFYSERYCMTCQEVVPVLHAPELGKWRPWVRLLIIRYVMFRKWWKRIIKTSPELKPDTCPGCNKKDNFLSESGKCPFCPTGTVAVDKNKTMRF